MARLTRRQLAEYGAEQLLQGSESVIRELAAYLVTARRTKEASLLVRDIESALGRRGVVVADVRTAHGLDESTRDEIEQLLKKKLQATSVQLRETTDTALLGGVTVRTADQVFDGSLRRSINELKAMKV